MKSPKLSIIIVAYQNTTAVNQCLQSIPLLPDIETIVINNTHINRGFAKACNLGAGYAKGNILFFLNPDTIVNLKAINLLTHALIHHRHYGVVAPQLLSASQKPYSSSNQQPYGLMPFIVYSVLNKYLAFIPAVKNYFTPLPVSTSHLQVGSVSGAALMIQKDLFLQLHGFDDRFFLYWEELDFNRRVIATKRQIRLITHAKIIHYGSTSTPLLEKTQQTYFRQSRQYFFCKHFGKLYAQLLEIWINFTEIVIKIIHYFI